MDALVMTGGATLRGDVHIDGAKNAALPLLAATLLADGPHTLAGVPDLADVRTMCTLLSQLGVSLERGAGSVTASARALQVFEAPYDLVRTMRASVLVLGPLLARFGECKVSLPGGCAIGARPIDQHLKGLEALGAEITLEHGYVHAKAKRLKGAQFTFDINTVTGTENVIMAAVLADGTTVLRNAALEPEIVDLCVALRSMGAQIKGDGTSEITIEGRAQLGPMTHTVMADRIEAGTFAAAALMTRGDVFLRGAHVEHLGAAADKLRAAGAQLLAEATGTRVRGGGIIRAVDVTTAPYPGFATDMQAQLMAALAIADGSSVFKETVFENRYMHVPELTRLGADITVDGHTAVVRGVKRLSGATVMATDLRASASLVLAGLVAEGETTIRRIYHLDRGYAHIERKLGSLGAVVKRVKET